jgi:hypothetical protein
LESLYSTCNWLLQQRDKVGISKGLNQRVRIHHDFSWVETWVDIDLIYIYIYIIMIGRG